MKNTPLVKHIFIFCVLLSGFPVLFNELLFYILGDLLIPGVLLYMVIMALTLALCIGLGIFFSIRLFKQKTYTVSTLPISLLVLIAAYVFTFIAYGFRSLLSPLQFELLLFTSAFLLPALIMTLALTIVRHTGSSLKAVATCLLLLGSISFALFSISKSFTYTYEEASLLSRLREASYTYYLPHSNVMDPSRIQLYIGGDSFKKGVSLAIKNENTDDTTPTYIAIEEQPRRTNDITQACGTEIVTTYLSKSHPDSYICTPIASSNYGSIYEVSYRTSLFDTHIKEYVLAAKDTYVYATYHSLSSTQPRVYDQEASVALLQGMEPVEPEVFLKRLVDLELQ